MEFLGKDYPAPELNFEVNGVRLECSQENTSLFVYRSLGSTAINTLAMYNHIFYHDEQQDMALYGFLGNRTQASIDELTAAMLAHGYDVYSASSVAECDIAAHHKYVIEPMARDLDDGIPPEWLDKI